MINLIPNQEKKKKVKDFYFRLVVVSFFVLGICTLVACVAILPSYFLSSVKKSLASTKLQIQQDQPLPVEGQNVLDTVSDVAAKLSLIEDSEKSRYLVSEKAINEVIMNKTPDIKIIQFSYENMGANGKKLVIYGVAPSRDQLLLFRKALEDDPAFKKVDLPISNFVRGSDIRFNINIIPL